jgi:hypothetical protein
MQFKSEDFVNYLRISEQTPQQTPSGSMTLRDVADAQLCNSFHKG